MFNLAAAVERADEFDIIHYEAMYYPMSLAFSRLSPTPIVQTLHHAPSAGRSRAVVALSRCAVHRHLQRAGARCCRAQRRRHGAARASTPTASSSARRPTTTCSFSAASPKARACCRRSRSRRRAGMKLLLVAAENDYYRDARRAARRWHADRLLRRSRSRRPRCGCTAARAPCSIRCRRASRSGWCSPSRWPAARRSPRSTAARSVKSSTTASPAACSRSSRPWSTGLPRVLALDRRTRPRTRGRAVLRASAWSTVTSTRIDASLDGSPWRPRRDSDAGSPAGPCSPSSRTPTTSRWRAAARWPGSPTPARASSCCARRAASAAARPVRCATTRWRWRASQELRCAAAALGIADVILMDHPGRRSALGARAGVPADIVADVRRYAPAASSRSAPTACTGISITSASTSARPRPCASLGADGPAALPRDHAARIMRAARRGRAVARLDGAAEGILEPGRRTPSASHAAAADDHRRRPAVGAAKAGGHPVPRRRRWARDIRSISSNRPKPSAGSASSTSIAPAIVPTACWNARRARLTGLTESTYANRYAGHPAMPLLRRPARARHLDVPPADRRRDPRRHPRLPLLHLPGRRRHSGAAPAAGRDRRARRTSRAGRPHLALRTMVGLDDDDAGRPVRGASRLGRRRPTASIVEALGPGFEGGYFLYRFSDPTFIVANAVVRAVAGTVLHGTRRAIDICGGSGHLTRSLMDLSSPAPVLADLYFAKIWLARRFTAPGCEPVCCDGNGAVAVRARRVRLRDVLGRVSVHLDQAAVRRRDVAPRRRRPTNRAPS